SACVAASQKIQISGDIHVLRVVAGIGLGEIEEEVALTFPERRERLIASIEHLVMRFMAQLYQCLEDLFTVFLFDLLFLLSLARLWRLGSRLSAIFPNVVKDRNFQFAVTHKFLWFLIARQFAAI